MEKWKEVFKGRIPREKYIVKLSAGEEDGLIILLVGSDTNVKIDFGTVEAVRMLDEGMVINGLYSDDELQKYMEDNFSNVIYEVNDGEFSRHVSSVAGEYYSALAFKHYVVITLNFNIDIITQWEPEVTVRSNHKERGTFCNEKIDRKGGMLAADIGNGS